MNPSAPGRGRAEAPAGGAPDPDRAIAIVGMAGRFSGANSVEAFWGNLCRGVESLTEIPESEVRVSRLPAGDPKDLGYVRVAARLEGIEAFDAAFFGMSPMEAAWTDPQQRLLLECAWEACEEAGRDPSRLPDRTAVLASAVPSGYLLNQVLGSRAQRASKDSIEARIGNDPDYLATRISHRLGLRGLSLSIQSACSSSLAAAHLACRLLRSRECDLALVGGTAVRVPQEEGQSHEPGGIVSSDGRTRAFDARADGTLFGSGVVAVVLKRLSDALSDRDPIHAVIRGTAVNNDGGGKPSFLATSAAGQEAAVREALEDAGVSADTVGFVEAHGTATPSGDPIEIEALNRAFRAHTDRRGFCAIGTLKSNVGHLNAASGLAGLVKAALAIERGRIPPSLHFERPNPAIDFGKTPFFVNQETLEWKAAGPRRASVHCLGIGGTNAHAILEEAPPQAPRAQDSGPRAILLSARTPAALETAADNLAAHLAARPEADLGDVAFTLQAGRKAFGCRLGFVAASAAEAARTLRGRAAGRIERGTAALPPPVAFVFPGHGDERVGMAGGLYREVPAFREAVDRCAEALGERLGIDVRVLIDPPKGSEAAAARALERTAVAQPALFVVQYALARMWMAWGLRPDAVAGASAGEIACACVAGAMSPEDALTFLVERGRLVQPLPEGAMLAAALSAEALAERLVPGLVIAVSGGPEESVASGPVEGIAALESRLQAERIACKRLPVSRAFHSAMMEPIVPGLRKVLARLSLRSPDLRAASGVTGTWIGADLADPEHWIREIRPPVRLFGVLRTLAEAPGRIVV